MITKGTKFGIGSDGDYAFYIYGASFTGIWGNNNAPTREQLEAFGFMEQVPPDFDVATHKSTNDLTDNGVKITNVVVALTPAELIVNAANAAFAVELEEARQKLRDLITEYPNAVYFVNNDYDDLDAAVNLVFNASAASSLSNLALACRAANKQQSKAIHDLAVIIHGMIKEDLQEDIAVT